MRFTEEEFYGNTQNTVLENGEVVPTNYRISRVDDKQSSKMALDILLTFLKTFMILVGLLFYFVSVTVCLSPKGAIKMFDFVGANKASLACYERIYKEEKTLASLYNLVQQSIKNKDHERTFNYIQELQGKSDYVDFCVKVNKATIKATQTAYIAYVGDLDGYLVSQNILAEYNSKDKIKARNIALQDLTNANVYSFGVSTFVDCLEDDKSLSSDEMRTKLLELINLNIDDKSVLDLIKQRRIIVDVSSSDGTTNDKILRVYTSLKIEKVLYKIYSIQGEEDLKTQAEQNIQELQREYNELIK